MMRLHKQGATLLCILLLWCISSALASDATAYPWQGLGTEQTPYLVQSAEDLWALQTYVNQGTSFENTVFLQTTTIDLQSVSWTPIGMTQALAFKGVYDGGGNVIENLLVEPHVGAGLFGWCSDRVQNVGIASGMVSASRMGAVVTGSTTDRAVLINCYSRAIVIGGLGDDAPQIYAGTVVNCWYGADWTQAFIAGADGVISCLNFNAEQQEQLTAQLHAAMWISATITQLPVSSLVMWDKGATGVTYRTDRARYTLESTRLTGQGSKENPYLIQSADDLRLFAALVNNGLTFEGDTVLQTCDIDLLNEEWAPIGFFGGGHYFMGVYDGGGHAIRRLRCTTLYNNGLFGQLAGSVYNLLLLDSTINGRCCGVIASHSAGTRAKIVNCYTNATVYAETRGGGIADNFSGGVVAGCVFDGLVNGTIIDDFISYDVGFMYACATTGSCQMRWTTDNMARECVTLSSYSTPEELASFLNARLSMIALAAEVPLSDLMMWRASDDQSLVWSAEKMEPLTDPGTVLQGSGKKNDPYQIATVDDLIAVAQFVNDDYSFVGQWLVQQNDLDFSNRVFFPIGAYGTGRCFEGVYDGGGHVIRHLNVSLPTNVGLFGTLGGTVMNVGVVDSTFDGLCVGSIASQYTGSDARILNCFSTATILAATRGGGIVDNLSGGLIANCYYDGHLNAGISGGIVSYNAKRLINCCSPRYPAFFEKTFSGKIQDVDVDLDAYSKRTHRFTLGAFDLPWAYMDRLLSMDVIDAMPVFSEYTTLGILPQMMNLVSQYGQYVAWGLLGVFPLLAVIHFIQQKRARRHSYS